MMKRFFPTLIALVVFIGLFVWVNLKEVDEIPAPGEDLPVDLAMVALPDIKAVSWNVPKNPKAISESGSPAWDKELRVEVKRDDASASYEIVKPRTFRAEKSELEGLLRNFENFRSERIISKTATATAGFGIGSESGQITIETATQTMTFTLGDASPLGGMVYLQKAGDPAVYLVRSSVSAAFNKAVVDLRAKDIFIEDFSSIGSLTLSTASGTFVFEQEKTGGWNMTAPKAMEADPGEVTGIISGIKDIRVAGFISDDPAENPEFGFSKPTSKAVFTDQKSGKTYELLVGKETGSNLYVKRGDQPSVYTVAKMNLGFLDKDLNRLRTKQLPRVPRDQVKEVVLQTASETYTISAGASETWTLDGKRVDAQKVSALIDAFNNDRVVTFLPIADKAKEQLDKPETCAQLKLVTDKETRHVIFGNGDGQNISLLLDKHEEIYKLPMHLFDTYREVRDSVQAVLNTPAPDAGVAVASGASVAPASAIAAPVPVATPALDSASPSAPAFAVPPATPVVPAPTAVPVTPAVVVPSAPPVPVNPSSSPVPTQENSPETASGS
jgi:hypothetical protein